jgi:O-antigen/teichoic acid export membrane protein
MAGGPGVDTRIGSGGAGGTVPASDPVVRDDRRLVAHGLGVGAAGALSSLVALALVPLLYRRLGAEVFGVWAVLTASAGLASMMDLGIGSTVTRLVARGGDRIAPGHIGAAAGAYLLLALMAGGGFALVSQLPGRGGGIPDWPMVVAALALGVGADLLMSGAVAVLSGHHRFPLVAGLMSMASVVRSVGTIAVLLIHPVLPLLAAVHALVSVGTAATALRLAVPASGLGWRGVAWPTPLRPHVEFSLLSFVTSILGVLPWAGGVLVVAMIAGPTVSGQFAAGLRLPQAIAGIAARGLVILYPAAARDGVHTGALGELFLQAARLMLVLLVPAAVVLIALSDQVIRLWIGEPNATASFVLRLAAVALVLEALVGCALQILWGAGSVRAAAGALAAGLGAGALAVGLLHQHGAPAAVATGLVVALSASLAGLVRRLAREHTPGARDLAARFVRSAAPVLLTAPVVAALAVALRPFPPAVAVACGAAVGGAATVALLMPYIHRPAATSRAT